MTALAADTTLSHETWDYREFILKSGTKAYKNGVCAIKLGTGNVVPSTGASDERVIGRFARAVDATSAAKLVNVRLNRGFEVHWLANGSSIAATDMGADCYMADDVTVSLSPTAAGASYAGLVMGVDSVRGVAVQFLNEVPAAKGVLSESALAAFSSGNTNVPSNPLSGTIYDIPATATAATVTLPATAREGTVLYFVADGVKNSGTGTIQYVDATGPTNITTALTAAKRHLVVCTFLNGKWNANGYVSP